MNFLIQINLGPVQGFIATARRSRDLWFGSYILSELSKSVALSFYVRGAQLIFPYADKLEGQLQPASDFLVTNIVFAEITADDLSTAKAVADGAQIAAVERWKALCEEALEQLKQADTNAKKYYDPAIWQAQLGDVVEIFIGIVQVEAGGYSLANNRLRELLANRKNTRSFEPYEDDFQRPKSSLDGAQSTVLTASSRENSLEQMRWRQRLGIEPTEQLDTAAMVKRVIGRERGFIPAARVAANAWIKRASKDSAAESAWKLLTKQLDQLAKQDIGTRLKGKYAEYGWLKPLLFDGQLLYRHRLPAELARVETKIYGQEFDDVEKNLKALDKTLAQLYASNQGAPCPYYGLLLADGDKMGQLIDKANEGATNADKHRNISKALSEFAQSVPALMNRFDSACIYSGGDDVLGLVPLDQALAVATALSESFKKQLDKVAQECDLPAAHWPTLSVGIAIVHFLQPLGDARQLAAKAEKIAKGSHLSAELQRNAVCLLAQPRSGQALTVRMRWNDKVATERLAIWTQQLGDSGCLPRGLPHELDAAYRECRAVYPKNGQADDQQFIEYWRVQLNAILSKKEVNGGSLSQALKEQLIADLCDKPSHPKDADGFEPMAQLLMARWLSGQAMGDEQ